MIIVTGGAGFIGSNLVRGLNGRGVDDILIVDDLEDGEKHLGLNALSFRDLVDYRDFAEDIERYAGSSVDAVFHQGACSDTMERDGRYMLRVNYEYSKRLLEFCIGRCPFLYASSASVYGSGERGFREEPACEYPLNVYAFSKFLFDRYVRTVLPGAPTQIVGLRYFNVFGPQENHKGRMASVGVQVPRTDRARGEALGVRRFGRLPPRLRVRGRCRRREPLLPRSPRGERRLELRIRTGGQLHGPGAQRGGALSGRGDRRGAPSRRSSPASTRRTRRRTWGACARPGTSARSGRCARGSPPTSRS